MTRSILALLAGLLNYLQTNGITWWKTPPESPDLNPIENVQGSLRTFL